jgi:hypothetical protein
MDSLAGSSKKDRGGEDIDVKMCLLKGVVDLCGHAQNWLTLRMKPDKYLTMNILFINQLYNRQTQYSGTDTTRCMLKEIDANCDSASGEKEKKRWRYYTSQKPCFFFIVCLNWGDSLCFKNASASDARNDAYVSCPRTFRSFVM